MKIEDANKDDAKFASEDSGNAKTANKDASKASYGTRTTNPNHEDKTFASQKAETLDEGNYDRPEPGE